MQQRKSKSRGEWGEQLAQDCLLQKNYRILKHHWTCREGELDFIATDTVLRQLVFIEVKMRTSLFFGTPEEAINSSKKRRIKAAIDQYLMSTSYSGSYRFDAICIVRKGQKIAVRHYKNLSLEEAT